VPLHVLEQRVQTANNDVAGGYTVGTDHRADLFVEPFRNSLLARRLGVRVLSGLTGNLSIPRHTSSTSAGWVSENQALTASDMSFGSMSLTPRHAGGISEWSRQMVQQSSPDIEQLVRNDLSFMLAQAIDTAILFGAGGTEPIGLLNTAGVQTSSMATPTWTQIVGMLKKLELVNATPTAWLMGANPKAKLMSIVDGVGMPAKFLDNGRMINIPAYSTNQLADKTGTPDTGRVILGDWSQIMLGIWGNEIDILVNPYAETAYSKGNIQIRAMTTCDIAVRHAESFVVADDVAL
jgi:HK97 family phage major capsid protein